MANEQVNSVALDETIRDCAAKMMGIKKSRATLNEQAGEIRERLKDAGIHTAAFAFALRLAEMETVGRDAYMQSLADTHKALKVGGQLDWVSANKEFNLEDEKLAAVETLGDDRPIDRAAE